MTGRPGQPGPVLRGAALDRLATTGFDLLVIGGGITGAGVALDASTRGMRVALIEKGDFASGTSSRSSKLVHGGLRYLEQREIGLMRESAAERDRLARLAPLLVKPLPFFIPRWAGGSRRLGAGLRIYDALASPETPRHRHVDVSEALQLCPVSRRSGGGYVYWDYQTDDARLTLNVLWAARAAGAVVCNYVRAEDLGGTDAGHVCTARDVIGGEDVPIRARSVVSATGVWADELGRLDNPESGARLRPSKGIHLVLPKEAIASTGAVLFQASDGRVLFLVPWRSSVLVGTTDEDYEGSLDTPSVGPEEAVYMLDALSASFEGDFGLEIVTGAYAGLRPLLAGAPDEATRDLSRRHKVTQDSAGVVTVTGGKLTTYRSMAEDVVDVAARSIGNRASSQTAALPLTGGNRSRVEDRARTLGLEPAVADSLMFSYGDRALEVLDLAEAQGLASPVIEHLPYLWAELLWGVREEMAVNIDDLLARRTRLSLEDREGGIGDPKRMIEILRMAGLDDAPSRIATYQDALHAERGFGPAVRS